MARPTDPNSWQEEMRRACNLGASVPHSLLNMFKLSMECAGETERLGVPEHFKAIGDSSDFLGTASDVSWNLKTKNT